MGLEKEIENLFRRVLELDLERLSGVVQPIYHTVTPPPVYSIQDGSGSPGSCHLRFDELIYQVQEIILDPLRLHELQEIFKRRQDRSCDNDADNECDKLLKKGKWREASELYLATGGLIEPIVTKHMEIDTHDEENPRVTSYQVINFLGVDYVDVDSPGKEDLTSCGVHDDRQLDHWPEKLRLRNLVGEKEGGYKDKCYIRCDLVRGTKKGNHE